MNTVKVLGDKAGKRKEKSANQVNSENDVPSNVVAFKTSKPFEYLV